MTNWLDHEVRREQYAVEQQDAADEPWLGWRLAADLGVVQTGNGSAVMMESLRALLSDATPQELASEQAPDAVLERLRTAVAQSADSGLSGRVGSEAFSVVMVSGPRSTRYPGAASGVVEGVPEGSRVIYTVDIPPAIRLVLRVFAAISAAIAVGVIAMALAAIAAGDLISVPFSLFVLAFLLVVWRHWSHLQRRSVELNATLRTILTASSGSTDRIGGLHNNKMQQTSRG
jgi:hypothetical protein